MVLYKNLEMDKQALLGPEPLTMERFSTAENMVISQSTSLFCRPCCLQPSINFSATDHATNVSTNDAAARRDAKNSASGWFHEESTLLGRTCSSCFPGGRAVKYVYHSGPIPQALQSDDATCCTLNVQSEATSDEFNAVNPNDLGKVEFYHEKKCTNGISCGLGDKRSPCCWKLPYLETLDASGERLGRTDYVCELCLFVPKMDVSDSQDRVRYRLRPDTCCLGLCVRPRCGGSGGKCCTVPFLVREPGTGKPVMTNHRVQSDEKFGVGDENAQVTQLWTGLKRCCTRKNAYALRFPANADSAMKATLTGATLLVDLSFTESDS